MFQITNIKDYIKNNRFIYFGVLILYTLGFIIGGVYSNFISDSTFIQSLESTKEFFKGVMISQDAINLRELIIGDITPFVVVSLCGILLAGLPFTLYFVFKSGFSLGFYISFLINAFSLKGFYLGMFYLVMNLAIVLPALTTIAVSSLDLNLYILASVNKNRPAQRSFAGLIVAYAFMVIAGLVLTVLSTNLKALLLPDIIKFLFSSVL